MAAHCLAANKVELQDEFVTFRKYRDHPSKPFRVDVWLEDGSIIDLGNYELQVLHTPGHTSGCICLYEPGAGLLFTGDTVFAGGTLSEIAVGGNVRRLVSFTFHPYLLYCSKDLPAITLGTPSKSLDKHVTLGIQLES